MVTPIQMNRGQDYGADSVVFNSAREARIHPKGADASILLSKVIELHLFAISTYPFECYIKVCIRVVDCLDIWFCCSMTSDFSLTRVFLFEPYRLSRSRAL